MGVLVDLRWKAAKDWRKDKEDQWQRWYELYRSYAERRDWSEVSLFIPLIFSTIESFLPRMTTQRPKIVVEARGDEDRETSKVHRELINYQWDGMGMGVVLMDWVKETFIYGTGILKIGWEETKRLRQFRSSADPKEVVSEEQIIKSAPVAKVVPIERFYVAPGSRDMETAMYTIELHRWTWDDIDAMAENGFFKRAAVNELEDKKVSTQNDAEATRVETERYTNFGLGDAEQAKKEAEIWEFDVLEYWENDRVCFYVPEYQVVLKNEKNFYWHGQKPYVRIVDNALPGEFYGVGEPEILQSLNIELNELHNLRLEAAKRAIFQMFKVRIGSPVSPQSLKFKQQGIVWVHDVQEDIQPLFVGQPQGPSYREEDVIRVWAQQTTGANDPFQGIESGVGSETATGASILAQAANSRVNMKFMILTEMGLRPLGKILMSLNEQYMDEDLVLRVAGPTGMTYTKISAHDIATNGLLYDIKIDVGATDPINREASIKKAIEGLSVIGQIIQDPTHPAIQAFLNRLFELYEIDMPPEMLAQQPNPVAAAAAQGDQPEAVGGPSDQTGQIAEALSSGGSE